MIHNRDHASIKGCGFCHNRGGGVYGYGFCVPAFSGYGNAG